MSRESFVYIGFADGASRHTQNSTSATWVIYTPTGQVFSSEAYVYSLIRTMLLNIVSLLSYCMMPFHMVFTLLRYILIAVSGLTA